MNHPHPIVLQSYVDGELAYSQQAEVSAHLAMCGQCQQMVEEIDSLGQVLRIDQPATNAFCCEQDFLGRLRTTIRQHKGSPWTMLALLPPLLLLAMATTVQLSMAITMSIVSLKNLHVLPLTSALVEKPVDMMFHMPLMNFIMDQGWLDRSSSQKVLRWWEQQGTQQGLALTMLIVSFLLILVLFGLGLLWFCCWKSSRSARDQGGQ